MILSAVDHSRHKPWEALGCTKKECLQFYGCFVFLRFLVEREKSRLSFREKRSCIIFRLRSGIKEGGNEFRIAGLLSTLWPLSRYWSQFLPAKKITMEIDDEGGF